VQKAQMCTSKFLLSSLQLLRSLFLQPLSQVLASAFTDDRFSNDGRDSTANNKTHDQLANDFASLPWAFFASQKHGTFSIPNCVTGRTGRRLIDA
jgi:hypothetical protein